MTEAYNLSSGSKDDPRHVVVFIEQQQREDLWRIIEDHAERFSYGTCCPRCYRDFKGRVAIPHSRCDLFAVDRQSGKQYTGTDIICADCAQEPYQVAERVRVYLSERDEVTLLHCQEVQSPLNLGHIKYDQKLN